MKTITFQCPGCGRKHQANEQFAGSKARCLRCGTVLEVVHDGSSGEETPVKERPVPSPPEVPEEEPPILPDTITLSEGEAEPEEPGDEPPPPPQRGKGSRKADAIREPGPGDSKGKGRPPETSRGPGRRPGRRGEEEDGEEEEAPEGSRARGPSRPGRRKQTRVEAENDTPRAKPKKKEPSRKRLVIVLSVAAVLIVAAGVTAFLLHRSSSSANRKPPVAAAGVNEPKAPPPTTAPEKPATPSGGGLAAAPRDEKPLRVRAAMLAREVAADNAAANRKYEGRLLEVRGPYSKLVRRVSGAAPVPGRPPVGAVSNAVLGEEENPVYCELTGGATAEAAWQKLVPGQSVVVRGVHRGGNELKSCELAATASAADEKYRGKEVELTGLVGSVAETNQLVIEPERTNGVIDVQCFFRASDAGPLAALRPGDQVTVHGLCRGRNKKTVEIHNARLVDTTAPEVGVARLPADALAREFEDDLLDDEPAPAADLSPGPPLPAPTLIGAYEADRAAADGKYRHKPVAVLGVVQGFLGNGKVVILENDTDQKLKLYCFFTDAAWREMGKPAVGEKLCVRGVCSGAVERKMLRLDNCEPADPANPSARPDLRRLTADYVPFVAGRIWRYDILRVSTRPAADYPAGTGKNPNPKGKPAPNLVRRHILHREGSTMEVFDVKAGVYPGSSLWDDPRPEIKWETEVTVPVASLVYRVFGNQVQVGPRAAPGSEGAWQPLLQLGIKPGASWEWNEGTDVRQVCKLVKFAEYEGRPAAFVQQRTVVKGRDLPVETEHVYVKGVGEVRRVTRDVATNKPLEEWRLLEDERDLRTTPTLPVKP